MRSNMRHCGMRASQKQVAALKQRASTAQLLPAESGASEGTGAVNETAGGEASEEMNEKITVVLGKVQGGPEDVDEKLVEQASAKLVEKTNAKLAEQVKVHKVGRSELDSCSNACRHPVSPLLLWRGYDEPLWVWRNSLAQNHLRGGRQERSNVIPPYV